MKKIIFAFVILVLTICLVTPSVYATTENEGEEEHTHTVVCSGLDGLSPEAIFFTESNLEVTPTRTARRTYCCSPNYSLTSILIAVHSYTNPSLCMVKTKTKKVCSKCGAVWSESAFSSSFNHKPGNSYGCPYP